VRRLNRANAPLIPLFYAKLVISFVNFVAKAAAILVVVVGLSLPLLALI
jgi:hypothetical protein